MAIIDLHCDTLTLCNRAGIDLVSDQTQLSLDRIDARGGWCQAFAVFLPDDIRGKAAVEYFSDNYRYYLRQLEKFPQLTPVHTLADLDRAFAQGRIGALLTVEGGSVFAGDPARVAWLAGHGVRMVTLTWNGANELAGGAEEDTGLTELGREVVGLMERQGIIVDGSHLGDAAFDQLLEVARRPFVASHSNSRSVCGHRRNLTDRQFGAIVERGGLVGLNFCVRFLADRPEDATLEQLLRHIRRFVELGGEDVIALGSDFDGADMPPFVSSCEKLARLGDSMIKSGLDQTLTEMNLWRNARDFFRRYGL